MQAIDFGGGNEVEAQQGYRALPAARLPRCPPAGAPSACARPAAGSGPPRAAPAPPLPAQLPCQHPQPAQHATSVCIQTWAAMRRGLSTAALAWQPRHTPVHAHQSLHGHPV